MPGASRYCSRRCRLFGEPQYDRYVFGARTITTFGLAFLSLESIRELFSAVAYLLLIASFSGGLVYAFRQRRPTKEARSLDRFDVVRLRFGLTVALASAGFITLYGLHLFARNIGHVYSEIVIAAFLMAALVCGDERNHYRDTALVALFGAWTAVFELLTGPLIVGLVLVGLIATNRRMPGPRPDAIAYAWTQALTFLLACGTVMLLQQVFASIATGRNAFVDFAVHLALRLQLHQVFDIQLPAIWQIPTNLARYGPSDIAAAIARALPLITYGSIEAAVAIFVLVSLFGLGGFWFAMCSNDPNARSRSLAIVSLLSIVPVWYLVFSNHTALHSLYMVRLVTALWIGAATIALVGWLAWFRTGRDVAPNWEEGARSLGSGASIHDVRRQPRARATSGSHAIRPSQSAVIWVPVSGQALGDVITFNVVYSSRACRPCERGVLNGDLRNEALARGD